jgi:nucleotide-binding universal stress UspA family protein
MYILSFSGGGCLMEKKLLVAIDGSIDSQHAVEYVAGICKAYKNINFTLYHAQPAISQYIIDEAEKSPKAKAELNKLLKKNSQAAAKVPESQMQKLVRLGVPETAIETATKPRTLGVAKDILEYSVAGSYDAIVLGRRGVSGLQAMVTGSVSANIVDNAEVVPVWIVDEKAASNHIMVAVDGSESSLRAVDHLSFIVGGTPDVKISFFHVTPRLKDVCAVDFDDAEAETFEDIVRRGDKACIDRFFSHALKMLKEAGVEKSQIEVETVEGVFRVGKVILEAYRKGKFGALVIGRRGMGKKFFTGSVSRQIIDQFSNGALWVVP